MSNIKLPKIEVLFEDRNCLVIDKPAGIMVHSDGRNKGPFITDWLSKHYPDIKDVGDTARDIDGNTIPRDGIVHRLDRETSGVLIIAKTKVGFESLKEQFQNRQVKKEYIAVLWGEMKEEWGTINRPIGRSGSDFRKWSAGRGIRGETKSAETYWSRIKTFSENLNMDKEEKFTIIKAEPKTGRTHQIRVHMNAINHPVVCDSLYAPKRPKVLGFERMALHSYSITFKDTKGKEIKVISDLPKDFKTLFKILKLDSKSL